jgi:hypothetical protein
MKRILNDTLFIIARVLSKKSEEQNKQYYTVAWVNDLFYRIDKAVAKKNEIEGLQVSTQTLEAVLKVMNPCHENTKFHQGFYSFFVIS